MNTLHQTLSNGLVGLENHLANDQNIYDFRITREKTKESKPILYFNIRYNDYNGSPSKDMVSSIVDAAMNVGSCAKAVGFYGAILDLRGISTNALLAYKLL